MRPGGATGHAYDRSTRALAGALGLEIEDLKNWNCCGAMEVKNTDPKLDNLLSARNLGIAAKMGHNAVLAPCNGCYHNLKKAEYDLRPRCGQRQGRKRAVRQGGPRGLPARQCRDHPCAGLDQARHRGGRPAVSGEEIPFRTEGGELLRLHVFSAAPYLPRKGQGAGQRIDLEAAFHGRPAGGGGGRKRRVPAEDRVLRRCPHAVGLRHIDSGSC